MKDGFVKVAVATTGIQVADCVYNREQLLSEIQKAEQQKVKLLVLPELCMTGYTCGDLFLQETLLQGAEDGLVWLLERTGTIDMMIVLGLPVSVDCKLYNVAAFLYRGELLALIPKTYMPNYNEFYERRQFSPGSEIPNGSVININGKDVPFGTDLCFCHTNIAEYTFGIEICEDIWAAAQPSEKLCRGGAVIMLNLSASNEVIGKSEYRRALVSSTSARLLCGYVYVSSGTGESTQDLVYSGHTLIAENGTVLAESAPFEEKDLTVTEIDVKHLCGERHKNTSFEPLPSIRKIAFSQSTIKTELTRGFEKAPFVPSDKNDLSKRAEAILKIQSYGL